jgi:two-component system, LytTR family, response regulator
MEITARVTRQGLLRTLIIDDEEHQRQSLEKMVQMYCPSLNVVGQAGGVKPGLEAIRKYKPELVLLDVRMADGLGFDLLDELLPFDFEVIFISAYEQYAMKASNYTSLNYLLKPVDPDELIFVVEKAWEKLRPNQNILIHKMRKVLIMDEKSKVKVVIKTWDSFYLIPVKDILFCEEDSGFTKFYIRNQDSILGSDSLNAYEAMLSENGFFRIHENYLINLRHIIGFENDPDSVILMDNDHDLPAESRRQLDMVERMKRMVTSSSL